MTSKEIKAAQDALDHVRVPTGPDGVLSEAGATLQLTQATLEVALQLALFRESLAGGKKVADEGLTVSRH